MLKMRLATMTFTQFVIAAAAVDRHIMTYLAVPGSGHMLQQEH